MKKQEGYWIFKAPNTPEFSDLPQGAFGGTEAGWNSLTPGYRREIYRNALKQTFLTHEPADVDVQRLARAEMKHQQSLVAIQARESL